VKDETVWLEQEVVCKDSLLTTQHGVIKGKYHIGASLKDLGKKWFAFSKMQIKAGEVLGNVV
jgi:hypothetical protein